MLQEYSSNDMALKILVDRTLRAIKYLKEEALQLEEDLSDALEKVKPEYKPSAKNLIHYVALRRHDMRELQADLRLLGLSSLGGIEPHVMASLNAVLMTLYNLVHQPVKPQDIHYHPIDHFVGNNLLEEHAVTVLGPPPRKRAVRRTQLLGDSGGAPRESAIRPPEGRVHRCAGGSSRPLPGGRGRHALPR